MVSLTRLLAILLVFLTVVFKPTDAFVTKESILKLHNLSTRTLKDWQVRLLNIVLERRLRFQRLLNGLRDADSCVLGRERAIKEANAALQAARACRYNNLPFTTYERKRDSCFMRASLLEKAEKLRNKCQSLERAARYACEESRTQVLSDLSVVQQDCVDIGRPVLGKTPDCAEMLPLKERLAAATATSCDGDGGETAGEEQELERLIKKADDRLDELLNGRAAPQSNDPRFPINF